MELLDRLNELIEMKGIAYKQGDDLVIEDSEDRITLLNSCNNGYIRYNENGLEPFDKESEGCTPIYNINRELILVAAVRNGNPEKMKTAFSVKLSSQDINILNRTTNRSFIAEQEGIDLDKFCDYTLIYFEFEYEFIFYGRDCPVELC